MVGTDGELVLLSLVVLSALTFVLGGFETRRWLSFRRRSELYWSVGLVLVGITLAQEAAVYAGYDAGPFLAFYFLLVALLVGILSLGSAELAFGPRWRRVYAAYLAAASALVAYFCFAGPISAQVVTAGVVTGSPGVGVIVASSLVTFPAAAIMAGGAILGVVRGRRWNLAYIAAGILVISAAGSLYIASFPVTLYYAEFAGVLLLFFGFVRLPAPSPAPSGAGVGGPATGE
ncbi:MAG TPA: hypothetical protein VGV89_03625 [Thermoplasmata archaeon]|nr:hypothetical protein [Thermoplasmata archaeon]